MRIRKATSEDADAIAEVLGAVVAEGIHSAIVKAWPAPEQRDYLRSLSPREAFHVAVRDSGGIAGFQSLDLYSKILPSMSHVASVGTFLLADARGQGVGRALWTVTAEFALQAQFQKAVIQVRASNTSAQSFYRALGFVECGRLKRQVLIAGIFEDEVVMELQFEGRPPST